MAGGARHYAELVLPALRSVADEPLVLVGHSFGGTVAAVVASTHPELVASLVLTGAPLIRARASKKAPLGYRTQRWLNAKGLLSDQRIEAARQKFGSSDYRNAQGIMRDVLVASVNESYERELETLKVTVDLVWGELDREVPLNVAERAALLLAGDHTLRVIQGVGHMVPLEAPDELVGAVERALAR